MSTGVLGLGSSRIAERTLRGDRWWLAPFATFVVFIAFVVYATCRAFYGRYYYAAPYLSPFYSPCLTRLRRRAPPTSASRSPGGRCRRRCSS